MECLLLGELGPIRVRVNLKRIIDENGILKNEIDANSLHEVHFTLQLYTHGKPQGAAQCSNFFVPKNLFDEPIIFNYLYQDLTLDSKIAISIWYCHHDAGPLLSATTPTSHSAQQSSISSTRTVSYARASTISSFGPTSLRTSKTLPPRLDSPMTKTSRSSTSSPTN